MPPIVCLTSLDSHQGPHLEILRSAGFEIRVISRQEVNLHDADAVIRALDGASAVVAGAEPLPRRVIEALPQLRVISRTGVGFDAIDLAACDERQIAVTTTPGVNHESVAEHTIALLMGAARGFAELDRRVRRREWKRIIGPRVAGSTLGLVGLGRIGQAVATRGVGLGMKVLAFDPYPNQAFADKWNIELVSFDDLLARADYVSLHLPYSIETKQVMNGSAFAKMKPGSVFLNTSRGQLVDEIALIDALRSGRLRAAGLDVFETEPLPLDSPLLEFTNVLMSGHVAGMDAESFRDTFAMAADTIVQLFQGKWPAERIQNLKGVSGWRWERHK